MHIFFVLNHKPVMVDVDPAKSLLEVLRNDLGLTGTKQGCDFEGECGACTVLLDDQAVRSCLTPVGKVAGRSVLTIEGLGDPNHPHPLQSAFIAAGAVQCGYCTPGMILAAKSLLDREPDPDRGQIIEALEGNICRCTGYKAIVSAVEVAAAQMRGEAVVAPLPAAESLVGGDMLRIDSLGKVTGQAQYVEDISMPGLLHARVLRSPYHHARLLSLDSTRAAQVPGVVRILTAADIPGENGFPDSSLDEPVLVPAGDTVKMKGAPVALVVATSPEQAQAGLEAIEATYEPLPHIFEMEEALKKDALPIHKGGNILSTWQVAHGDLEAAFGASDVILEASYYTAYLEHAALERESVLGYIDEKGRVTVVAATHEPHWAQGYIAGMLALDQPQVRVIVPPTGGSFGGKQDPWPLIAAALMVYWVRQPVRLIYSRRESFDASPKRHPYLLNYKVGATRAGKLTGIQVRIDANTGGYDAGGYYIPNYAITASGGPYLWQAVDALAQSVYTNGPKSGQFRGYGTPQSIFALECTLDELTQKLDVDPLEFRLKNMIQQSSITFLGYPIAESLGYGEVLETIRPHYLALQEEVAAFNAAAHGNNRGRSPELRQGLGLAGMWYRFGKSGPLQVEAHAELADDGHFIVYCSAPDYGQGINTVMSQLAAETLGVSRDTVELVNADTARTPDSGVQGASRATYWVGNAVCSAAQNLKLGIQATAAELLDCPPDDLTLTAKRVVCRSDPGRSISLVRVAQECDYLGESRRAIGWFDLSPLFPEETRPEYVPIFVTGAQLAQVTVNLRTGEVHVDRVVAVQDVGHVINPLDARGQVEGSIVMGLGAALMEEIIPGASTGFSDYYLPTIKSMPEIEVMFVEVPSFRGPLGAKGLGEAAMLPTAPAIINAVSHAIGARLRELPATPERVLRGIESANQVPGTRRV